MIPKKIVKVWRTIYLGGFATTNDDVVTVKEDQMLDTDDSKGTTVVGKGDSKENSKGMEDDMFGDFATTNDDVATVKEEPMLDIDDSKGTTVEEDDSNSNVVGDSNVSPDNDSKENSKGMRTICLEILLQQMTTWLR